MQTVLPYEDEDEASIDGEGNVTPRTDYNNPAKSTNQSSEDDERVIRLKPYTLEPNKENYSKLARHFGGAPLKTIKKTFESATQLGRLGAVEGLRLHNRHK